MIFDGAAIALLLIFAFWGSKRGILKMVLSIVSFAVAIVLGCLLYNPISALLESAGIGEGISNKILESGALDSVPGVMLDVPFVSEGAEALADSAAAAALCAVSFLAVVILSRLVLFLVSVILSVAGRAPVVRQANGLAGAAAGICVGILIEFIILGVIAVLEIFGKTSVAPLILSDSTLTAIMYNNNPLLGIAGM